ncbi:MAG: nitrous oxide reductase family maturation protein NosD [Candidatus Promineifilaceae bacterium]|nr:nitrous oxide reductase family maturation protein NosD [Candidatus Promineifilaceae bacterium]
MMAVSPLPRRSTTALVLLLVLAALLLTSAPAAPAAAAAREANTVTSAERLAEAIAAASPGDVIEVDGGVYVGSLEIDRPLTLVGRNWPIVDGQNKGTIITVSAPEVTIRGFHIRNSGDSLDQENSGIAVEAAGAIIAGNRFEETLFGIYLRQANRGHIEDNVIHSKDLPLPRRGDPIRVWYSNDVTIVGNQVVRGRDVVLWYSERLTVRDNDVRDGRYGLHFMYCDDAVVEGNRLLDNSVGAFLMYSRRLTLRHNTISGNRGPSGYGVGLKDMDEAVIVENVFLDNRVGAYLDGSPREVDSLGLFEGNTFAYNDIGVELLPAVRNNQFVANSFVENEEQVAISGGGQPGDNAWTVAGVGNFWSNYAGFDADEDGRGDIAYVSQRLFEDLMRREPALRLFRYSPAVDALDFAARAFPVVRPQPKLEDAAPLMTPRIPAAAPPLPAPEDSRSLWGWSLLLLLPGVSLLTHPLLAVLTRRESRSRYRLPLSKSQLTH